VAKAVTGLECVLQIVGRLSDTQRRLFESLTIHHENGADFSTKPWCRRNHCHLAWEVRGTHGFS
jgi:hypothetical protein